MNFNPRARVGRDAILIKPRATYSDFNPRARVGRDLPLRPLHQKGKDFNPRARVGRDMTGVQPALERSYFNPRARVGRDPVRDHTTYTLWISIHAPAWGATAGNSSPPHRAKFQSTRPRGARQARLASWSSGRHFNPRARVGRDPTSLSYGIDTQYFNPRARVGRDWCGAQARSKQKISIHAPAWGATSRDQLLTWLNEFQSTRPRGARPAAMSVTQNL